MDQVFEEVQGSPEIRPFCLNPYGRFRYIQICVYMGIAKELRLFTSLTDGKRRGVKGFHSAGV